MSHSPTPLKLANGPAAPSRWQRLLDRVVVIHSATDQQALIKRLLDAPHPQTLAFINAHAMNCAVSDQQFFQALMSADLLLRDGSGVRLLMRRLHRQPGLNMNGTDFIPQLLAQARLRKIALWGTTQATADAAATQLRTQLGLNIVSTLDGFQPAETYLAECQMHQPELIVLGMGMPKQEGLSRRLAENAQRPCLIVCGGAILDFLGGRALRAPSWIRALGCEWVYRLLREPRRLARRYLLGNPLFLLRMLKERTAHTNK